MGRNCCMPGQRPLDPLTRTLESELDQELEPCYHVTMVPCYRVTVLPCYRVTMLPCKLVTDTLTATVTVTVTAMISATITATVTGTVPVTVTVAVTIPLYLTKPIDVTLTRALPPLQATVPKISIVTRKSYGGAYLVTGLVLTPILTLILPRSVPCHRLGLGEGLKCLRWL